MASPATGSNVNTPSTFTPTVASIPPANPSATASTSSSSDDYYDCPPFPTESTYLTYIHTISPRRELICPITQEVFTDPVVAEDGHTYERTALLRWYAMGGRRSQPRSPVTNALLSNEGRKSMMANLAVQGMAMHHKEERGMELLRRAKYAFEKRGGKCGDGGARIEALLDAGADTSLRSEEDGNTALHLFVLRGNLEMGRVLLGHDAGVTSVVNKEGLSVVQAAESYLSSAEGKKMDVSKRAEWNDFLDELRAREESEKQRLEARTQARNRANEEHREQQRNLAAQETRARIEARAVRGARGALGDLEDGWGYFPSLAVLQFQGAVPDPPASMVEYERRAKRRLDVVLNGVGLVVLFYFLLS